MLMCNMIWLAIFDLYFIQTEFLLVVDWFYRAIWCHCTKSTIVNLKEYNWSQIGEKAYYAIDVEIWQETLRCTFSEEHIAMKMIDAGHQLSIYLL